MGEGENKSPGQSVSLQFLIQQPPTHYQLRCSSQMKIDAQLAGASSDGRFGTCEEHSVPVMEPSALSDKRTLPILFVASGLWP